MKNFPLRFLPDIVIGIVTCIISMILYIKGYLLLAFLPSVGIQMLWCVIQCCYYHNLTKSGIAVNAVLIDYHYKRNKQKKRGLISVTDSSYTTYAPVMRYETEQGEITSRYCSHLMKRSYEIGKSYLIYYAPSRPELFWFPDRKYDLTEPYLTWILGLLTFLICGFLDSGK